MVLSLLACMPLAAGVQGPTPQTGAPQVQHRALPPCQPAPLVAPAGIAPYSAIPAPSWTSLFDGDSGWTGADGVYSIPLSGDERPCAAHATRTFFTFSDTFIGEVNAAGQRLPGTVLVNNTQALLEGGLPEPGQIEFFWDDSSPAAPGPVVVPSTAPGEFFWPQDGLVQDGFLYLYSLRMAPDGGPFGLSIGGVSLLRWPIDGSDPFGTYEQLTTPLQLAESSYGRAVFPNTSEAFAPSPDGFIYVYGLRELPLNKQLVAARVSPGNLPLFGSYRFWTGSSWSGDLASAAPIVDRMSAEFSVSPLSDGRVLLCYQQDDFLGADVTVRIGQGPVGPFGPAVPIYAIPETGGAPDLFAYGAKAHPHLSKPGRLLISYHVNTFDFAQHFADADIYRPRFIELPLVP